LPAATKIFTRSTNMRASLYPEPAATGNSDQSPSPLAPGYNDGYETEALRRF
jgi:hypothetical protein